MTCLPECFSLTVPHPYLQLLNSPLIKLVMIQQRTLTISKQSLLSHSVWEWVPPMLLTRIFFLQFVLHIYCWLAQSTSDSNRCLIQIDPSILGKWIWEWFSHKTLCIFTVVSVASHQDDYSTGNFGGWYSPKACLSKYFSSHSLSIFPIVKLGMAQTVSDNRAHLNRDHFVYVPSQ